MWFFFTIKDSDKQLEGTVYASRRQWTNGRVDWEKVKEEWMQEHGEEEITKVKLQESVTRLCNFSYLSTQQIRPVVPIQLDELVAFPVLELSISHSQSPSSVSYIVAQ